MQHNLAFRPKEMANDEAVAMTSNKVTATIKPHSQLCNKERQLHTPECIPIEIPQLPTPPSTPPQPQHPSHTSKPLAAAAPPPSPTPSQITYLEDTFTRITLRTLPTLAGGLPCYSEDLPCPQALHHILVSIDFYFMQQVDLVWPGDIQEMQDYWQLLLKDVVDLVNTVGMEAAEQLVDGALGEDWRKQAGYSG